MPSPETLDFGALLAPIAGENAAGESVRYAGPYDVIQEARRSDDGLEKGDWAHEEKKADWSTVIAVGTETLAGKSKDLQIAAWLVEALVKRDGFAGLRDGLRLVREILEQFWDALYPQAEDGDLSFRAGPIEWLNSKLPGAMRGVPMTQGDPGYSWLRWQESREVENLGRQSQDAMAAAVAEGKITGEQFDRAVAATRRAYAETLFADLAQASEEFERLDRTMDERYGREAPSLADLRKAIAECRELAESVVRRKREQEPDAVPAEADLSSLDTGRASGAGASPGRAGQLPLEPIDRADALRRLAAVAAFFRRTEPHSPVAYLVQRAIRWGEMPLDQWLQDVIESTDVLGRVRETLGIKNSGSD